MSWEKYLSIYGLSDKPAPISDKARKAIADRGYYIAEKIKAADQVNT